MVLTLLGAGCFVLAAVLWLLAGASSSATDVTQFTVVPLLGIPGAVLLLVGAARWPTRTALVIVFASVAILVVVPLGIALFVVAAVVWDQEDATGRPDDPCSGCETSRTEGARFCPKCGRENFRSSTG